MFVLTARNKLDFLFQTSANTDFLSIITFLLNVIIMSSLQLNFSFATRNCYPTSIRNQIETFRVQFLSLSASQQKENNYFGIYFLVWRFKKWDNLCVAIRNTQRSNMKLLLPKLTSAATRNTVEKKLHKPTFLIETLLFCSKSFLIHNENSVTRR